MHQRFFSIVVPAHNEEKLIRETLSHLAVLQYSKDRYEVIVVENGSTDKTFEIAKRFESPNCRVMACEKGVSRARNFGVTLCSSAMDWCLYLDADTLLEPSFLEELNVYLDEHKGVVWGTATIRPNEDTRASRFWYWYTNVTDKMLKVMQRVHIVRADLARSEQYDETLSVGEDLHYGRALGKRGTYFFMPTHSVISSTRRFKKKGYIRMFFINMRAGLPKWLLKHLDWEVVR